MHAYQTVLFLHIAFLLLGFTAGGIIHVCLFKLKAAQSVEQAGPWGALAGQTEKFFPVAILGLFATGAYMTSDVWTWGTSWIDVAIVVLVLLGVQGGGIAARRAHVLKETLMANGPGALGDEARAMTRDRMLWIVSFVNPSIVVGTVWNMTQKPGWAESIAVIAGTYAIGVALALYGSRAPAVEASPATQPVA